MVQGPDQASADPECTLAVCHCRQYEYVESLTYRQVVRIGQHVGMASSSSGGLICNTDIQADGRQTRWFQISYALTTKQTLHQEAGSAESASA